MSIQSSIQEAMVQFSSILNGINDTINDVAGVDVLWFRAKPDKRSQDVIFQSYTLYGVEDCPLELKAIYSDTGYDDAAITYQIMGLSYAIPLTLEIPIETWNLATGNDGTIPQEKDIVFIPISRKLLQVVSMTPVKKLAAQLTSYKVNLSVYTPTRSRLVGENLKESIKENTVNLESRFGDDIDKAVKNIVDNNQLSLYTSTNVDKQKTVHETKSGESSIFDIRNIVSKNLMFDGHVVSRSQYDMSSTNDVVVSYGKKDSFNSSESGRCYSSWFMVSDHVDSEPIVNIKDSSVSFDGKNYTLSAKTGGKFKNGDKVIYGRGVINIYGTVVENGKILLNTEQVKSAYKSNKSWNAVPGFSIRKAYPMNLISGDSADTHISINVIGQCALSFSMNDTEKVIQLPCEIKRMTWYGIIINISDTISIDVFSSKPSISRIASVSGVHNDIYNDIKDVSLSIKSSEGMLTNIRLYSRINRDLDKQLKDLTSYNSENDYLAIINDSADTYLNKPYIGKQR